MEPKESPRSGFEPTPMDQQFERVLALASEFLEQMHLQGCSSGAHYHIRWHPKEELDWEPFASRESAEVSAKQLCREGEHFTIEECHELCLLVGPKAMRNTRFRAAS